MNNVTFPHRYWISLTRAGVLISSGERGREGYTFWQRYWASLIGIDLPVRPSATVAGRASATATPRSATPVRPATGHPGARWFSFPRIPEAAELLAADDNSIVAAAASPDGRAELFVHRRDTAGREFTVEVMLRDFDALPAVMSLRYRRADGSEQEVLVPLARQDIGPATAHVAPPGFDGTTDWRASVPDPVDDTAAWAADTVTISVGAAVDEVTRDAWRQVRDIVPDHMKPLIEEALR